MESVKFLSQVSLVTLGAFHSLVETFVQRMNTLLAMSGVFVAPAAAWLVV
jgi:hypothetical protein